MALHACPDCGYIHGLETDAREDPSVLIARIQADKELAIARLQAGADKHVANVEAEATVEAAKAEAKAMEAVYSDQEADEHVVEAVNAVAAGLDAGDDSEGSADITGPVLADIDVEQPDVPPPPVEHEEHEHKEKPKKKGFSLGAWG